MTFLSRGLVLKGHKLGLAASGIDEITFDRNFKYHHNVLYTLQ